jgi:CBS domain-containing protein
MLVHELMTRDVTTLRSDTPLLEAARTLLDRDVTAAPVVHENGQLVGVVSRRDLVVGREIPDPRAHLAPVHRGGEPPHVVGEVMTRLVLTILPEDDTAQAASVMQDNRLASLPVVDRHHRLVGMISVTDLLRAHSHSDDEIADALRERFAEYGDGDLPGDAVSVRDGVVTIEGSRDHLSAVIAETVAETTEGVVSVQRPRRGDSGVATVHQA